MQRLECGIQRASTWPADGECVQGLESCVVWTGEEAEEVKSVSDFFPGICTWAVLVYLSLCV